MSNLRDTVSNFLGIVPNHTLLINQSGGPLEVKEGTSGAWRTLKTLLNNEEYDIKVDSNATYREYWCVVEDSAPNQLILSSDDCQECMSVRVMMKENGAYYFVKQFRKGINKVVVDEAKDIKTHDGSWWKWVKKLPWIGRTSHRGSTSTETTGNEKTGQYLADF